MLRNTVMVILIFFLSGVVSCKGERELEEAPVANETPVTSMEMPQRFENTSPGTSLDDFIKIHPRIRPTHDSAKAAGTDAVQPNQSFYEVEKNHPFPGISWVGMYQFKEYKLSNMLLVWSGSPEKMKEYRSQFIPSVIEKWGSDFERRVMKQIPGSDKEHLAPLLLWHKGKAMVALSCTPPEEALRFKMGACMLHVFSEDDEMGKVLSAGEKVSVDVKQKLFESIGIVEGKK